jgi:hypothetical protein
MLGSREERPSAAQWNGTDMRRVIVIVVSGLALAGCTSGGGFNTDWFPKFEPAPVNIQFQSQPAGAEAKTTTGQSCKTPCSLAMAPDKEFSVTFSLTGYQPQTVALQVTKPEGVETALQPNPVEVELVAAPKTPAKRTPTRKPTATTAAAPRPAAPPRTSSQPSSVPPPPTDPWPPVR